QFAQVLRHRQTVAAEVGDLHVVLDQLLVRGGDGQTVGAGVGEGGQVQRPVLLGGGVGLDVEAVEGAQAQVGGLFVVGGVAQHLGGVLVQQAAAHGDVVVDHHRPQLRQVAVLPLVDQVDVQGDAGAGDIGQVLADGHGQPGDQHRGGDGGRGGAQRTVQRPGLGPAVALDVAGIGVDGAGRQD